MKKFILLLPILLAVSCNGPEKRQAKELRSLEETIKAFNLAFQLGDLPVLDSLTTDRYLHTNSSDRSFSKKRWFNYLQTRTTKLESGLLKINKYEFLEQEIELYDRSAIVTGMMISSGFNEGEPFNSQIRVSNFWVKEGDTWKRAGFHDTRIN